MFTASHKNAQFSFPAVADGHSTRLEGDENKVTSQRDNFQNVITSQADLRNTLLHNMVTWDGEVSITRDTEQRSHCCRVLPWTHFMYCSLTSVIRFGECLLSSSSLTQLFQGIVVSHVVHQVQRHVIAQLHHVVAREAARIPLTHHLEIV